MTSLVQLVHKQKEKKKKIESMNCVCYRCCCKLPQLD